MVYSRKLKKTISCVYQIQNFSGLLYTLHGGVVLGQGRVNLTVPFHLCKSWIYTCQFNDKELNSAQSILENLETCSLIHVQSYKSRERKIKSLSKWKQIILYIDVNVTNMLMKNLLHCIARLFFLGQIKHLLVHAIKAKFLYEEFLKHQILKSALCFLFGGSEHQILSWCEKMFLIYMYVFENVCTLYDGKYKKSRYVQMKQILFKYTHVWITHQIMF